MERTIELDLRMLKHRQYVDDVNQFGWLKTESATGAAASYSCVAEGSGYDRTMHGGAPIPQLS